MQVTALLTWIAHLDHTSATSIRTMFLMIFFVGRHRKWLCFFQENCAKESFQAIEPSFASFELDSGNSTFFSEFV